MKKIFTIVLSVVLCFSITACRMDKDEQTYKVVGEWDIPHDVTYDLKPSFREDGTCTIDGKVYKWELEELRNKVTEYRVFDGDKVAYSVNFCYGDEGYDCIYVYAVETYDGTVTFITPDGRYYRGSDYEKIEINNDNWQDYFELREAQMRVKEDYHKKVTSANISRFLALKSDYGVANHFISNVKATVKYNEYSYNYTVDYDNKTYELSKPIGLPTKSSSETIPLTEVHINGYWKYGMPYGTMEFDGETSGIITNDFDRTLIDIEGVMYCYIDK